MGSTHVTVSDKHATSSTPPRASVLQSEIEGGPLYQRHPPDHSFFSFSLQEGNTFRNQSTKTWDFDR